MGQIYRQAEDVLIWLGEADEQTSSAFSFIDIIHDCMADWYLADRDGFRQKIATSNNLSDDFGIPPPGSPAIASLDNLLRRPWFSRAWVFQESVLASRCSLRCGSYEISGDRLGFVCILVSEIDVRRPPHSRYFSGQKELERGMVTLAFRYILWIDPNSPYFKLVNLLDYRRGSEATDPRDIVFSLLGIATDGQHPSLKVDYRRSVEEVYVNVSRHLINEDGNLLVLSLVDTKQPVSPLPTWVPDFRNMLRSNQPLTKFFRVYSATGTSRAALYDSDGVDELCLSGWQADTVNGLGAYHDTANEPFHEGGAWSHMADAICPGGTYQPTNESAHLAFSRTACYDSTEQSLDLSIRGPEPHRLNPIAFEKYLSTEEGQRDHTAMISRTTLWRRFFTTSSGYMGMAPLMARQGDKICLALGGEVPLLCRPSSNGGYTFVGECYVHGLMDGEGLISEAVRNNPTLARLDRSWINRLHEEPLPFEVGEILIR